MYFEALAKAIDDLEVPGNCDAIRELAGLMQQAEAKMAPAIDEVNRSGEWELEGATSMVAWLKTNARMTAGGAKTATIIAERLASLPVTSAAWQAGDLSSDQIRVIVSHVKARRTELFAEHEAAVVPALSQLTVAETALAMDEWRRHADALDDTPPSEAEEGELYFARGFRGEGVLRGAFGPDDRQVVDKALQLAATHDGLEETRSPAKRRADALVDICRYYLDHQTVKLGKRHRPHLNVVVNATDASSARYLDGTAMSESRFETLLCDCNLHKVFTAGRSAILDYGRSVRSAPPDLFNAVALRDGHCRMPGCDRGPEWCDAHHIEEWEPGGETKLSNLVLKCSRHHQLWHKRRKLGWTERLDADGTLTITAPSGRTYITDPAGPAAPRQLWAS